MQSAGSSSSSSAPTGGGKPDRLYIGNLSPTVDEYTLIQVLQKFGKITKLDFMFHKTGVLKGKPRGYAFVEFSNKDDALKAMVKLHDRLLRGRKLQITYANSAPTTDLPPPRRSRHGEAPKTTTLSLLKSKRKPQSAAAQIAAMEAKLAMMQQRKPADEDYVPGQSFATTSSAGPSRSVSPGAESPASGAAEGSVEPELADAELAADDLMREVWAEMQSKGPEREETQGVGSGQVSVSHTTNKAHAQGILLTTLNSSTPPQNLERTRTASLGPASTATTTTSAPTSSSAGLPKPMISSLPPRPSPAVTEMAMRDRDRDAASISGGKQPERGGSQAQSDAIKRGLASLPKKPTF